MKNLTLQITKLNFDLILSGDQKIETREVRKNTVSRYLDLDNDGNATCVKEFNKLTLINGRQPTSPRLEVEVLKSELIIETDEDDKEITYTENGVEYISCFMEYTLGKILNKQNC